MQEQSPTIPSKNIQETSLTEKIKFQINKYAHLRSQKIFLLISFIVLIGLLPLLRDGLKIQYFIRTNKIPYNFPKYADFYISIICYLILARIRKAVTISLKGCMERRVSEKYKGKDRHLRALKMSQYVFKGLYFTSINIFGYLVLRDLDFTPASLFGKGDPIRTFKGYPYVEYTPILKYYYLISLSYHIDSFVSHVMDAPRNDFGEMFLHHFVTMCLIIFSYISNYIRVGSLVMFCHDQAEIFVSLTKIFVDWNKKGNLAFFFYIGLISSWFYTRCFVFPRDIIYRGSYLARTEVPDDLQLGITIFIGMLCVLVILHYYWFMLFMRMGYNFVFKGEAKDIQAGFKQEEQNKKIKQN